ncbi:uncharacterized protein A4U43_C04F1120 [Asparagus officinalis]|uniref:Nucleoporin NSP1-like C-terminal domain-containing protein n=1 Tax=Asparagus officinalis TaxID=4686 RepID=A0A5P1EXA1_ASPOF|nr:uncharacterized protein A4U43_C04F1120 [Asparagus officinalis]
MRLTPPSSSKNPFIPFTLPAAPSTAFRHDPFSPFCGHPSLSLLLLRPQRHQLLRLLPLFAVHSTPLAHLHSLLAFSFAGTSALISASTSASSSTTSQTLSSTIAASSSGTSASISSTTSQSPKFPSEIVGKNVEEIIKDWNSELQERTTKFRKHAVAIAEWDRRILRNRDVLLRLEAEVAKVVETQAFLEKQLELIETHQQEVDKALQSMEGEAERVYEDERGLLLEDEAAFARDSMYEQAEFIESELQKMAEQIKLIIEKVNAKQGGDLSAIDGMTPIDFVVRILNNQLSSLMWIDEKANEFSTRIKKLASHGTGSDHDMAEKGSFVAGTTDQLDAEEESRVFWSLLRGNCPRKMQATF